MRSETETGTVGRRLKTAPALMYGVPMENPLMWLLDRWALGTAVIVLLPLALGALVAGRRDKIDSLTLSRWREQIE